MWWQKPMGQNGENKVLKVEFIQWGAKTADQNKGSESTVNNKYNGMSPCHCLLNTLNWFAWSDRSPWVYIHQPDIHAAWWLNSSSIRQEWHYSFPWKFNSTSACWCFTGNMLAHRKWIRPPGAASIWWTITFAPLKDRKWFLILPSHRWYCSCCRTPICTAIQ